MNNRYFKAIDRNKWIRNPLWPQIPSTADRAFIVWAVFEDEVVNECTITTVAGQNINWGDGNSVTSGSLEESHTYNYATISAPIILHPSGRNYKPVLIEIDRDGNNPGNFFLQGGTTIAPNNALEIEDRMGSTTGVRDYRLSLGSSTAPTTRCARYVERISLNTKYNASTGNARFHSMFACRVFEVPSDFFENLTSVLNMFYQSFDNCDLTNLDLTQIQSTSSLQNAFLHSGKIKLGDINCETLIQVFQNSNVTEIGDITSTSTSMSSTFNHTNLLRKIGVIDAPNVTTIINAFNRSSVEEVVFIDCSAITVTTNAFLNAICLRKLIMPGLTRGVDISNGAMQAQELDDFFTSLGTASGSQTIIVTGNPGAATCDTTIATGKGFTVTT